MEEPEEGSVIESPERVDDSKHGLDSELLPELPPSCVAPENSENVPDQPGSPKQETDHVGEVSCPDSMECDTTDQSPPTQNETLNDEISAVSLGEQIVFNFLTADICDITAML